MAAPRDQYHSRARAIAAGLFARGERLVGTVLVLSELHGLVLQRQGIEAARENVRRLMEDPGYSWQDVSLALVRGATAAWLERFRDQQFSLTDAVSFELMRRQRIRAAFAFDRHFVTAGFELLE